MTVSLSPLGGAGWQFFDDNGDPLSGGKLYTYAAGTTTPATTYTTSDGGTPNTNPIILDSAGRVPQEIWLTDGVTYKFALYTSTDTQIWVKDNIAPISASSSSGGGSSSVVNPINVLDYMTEAQRADVLNRTGLYDDSAAIVAAATAAVSQGRALYCPGGQYNFGAPGQLRATSLTVNVPAGKSLYVYGDGPGNTVFKEAAGQNAVIGRFDYMWYVTTPIGATASSVTFRDLTVDKNGASNGAPPTPYAWEQSHCIAITPGYTSAASSGAINAVFIENVETLDKVGAGINLGGGAIYAATLINCHGRNFSGLFGERGDLEFQASVGELLIMNCTGNYVQSEPNVTTPFLDVKPKATFVSCQYTVFDLLGYSGNQDLQQYALVNCETPEGGEFWARNGVLTVTGGKLGVSSRIDWRNATSRVTDCTIVVKHDTATDTFSPLYISAVSLVKHDHIFTNCNFVPQSTATTSTTGYAFLSQIYPAGANHQVIFQSCAFSPVFQRVADCYRGGNVTFSDCKLVSRAGASSIRLGGDNVGQFCNVVLDTCDLTGISGTLLDVAAAGTAAWSIRFVGTMDYSKFSLTGRPATEYQDTKVVHNCIWTSDARPAAAGLNGQIVRIRKPTLGTAAEYVCSVGNITTATWRISQQAGTTRSTTANRPVPNANDIGLVYLDTTLDADGKPIWWNGTAWVDATGAVV